MHSSKGTRKRYAYSSPMDPKNDWNLKRSKSTSPTPSDAMQVEATDNEGMEMHFSMVVYIKDNSAERDVERDVVGPNQPPQSP